MKIRTNRVDINIELNNGIYIFDNQAATGKTRLCSLIKEHTRYSDNAVASAYTYNDKLDGYDISKVFKDEYKLIVLDRYDMYYGDGIEYIKKFRNKAIILIDCKQEFNLCEYDEICFIEMTHDSIKVVSI